MVADVRKLDLLPRAGEFASLTSENTDVRDELGSSKDVLIPGVRLEPGTTGFGRGLGFEDGRSLAGGGTSIWV